MLRTSVKEESLKPVFKSGGQVGVPSLQRVSNENWAADLADWVQCLCDRASKKKGDYFLMLMPLVMTNS